jgi:hypothetical protein
MKIVVLLMLLLVVGLVMVINARRRLAREQAEAQARARAARRARVPTVSNNVKGVTATQTLAQPYRPGTPLPQDADERAA